MLDLQQYFADPQSHAYLPALAAVQNNILTLIHAFRQAGRPIIFTRQGTLPEHKTMMRSWWHDELRRGEPRAELIPSIATIEPDLLLDKECYSAFQGTSLLTWLKDRRCNSLTICGVMTHLCCETTAREAFMLGLSPVVVADGCASLDEELHLGSLRNLAHGFAVVSSTAQITHALSVGNSPRPLPATSLPALPVPSVSRSTMAEVVVVGGGPAGLAAAVQARRSGLNVQVVEHRQLGGQARSAECIENYLGFPGGISGQALMDRFETQARSLGIEFIEARVKAVTLGEPGRGEPGQGEPGRGEPGRGEPGRGEPGLWLELSHASVLSARVVVLASGARALPFPRELGPAAIYSLADLPSLRGKQLLIIGGGEAAFDQALLAHRQGAQQVTIAVRGRDVQAMALLVRRAHEREIQVLTRTTLGEVSRSSAQGAPPYLAHLDQVGPGPGSQRMVLPVDAVLVSIGKKSVLPLLPAELEHRSCGTPLVDSLGRTSIEGLYIVGDAHRGIYRQVSIATGDGVASAMHAARYLSTGVWKEG